MTRIIEITGCGDCVLSSWGYRGTYCKLQIERSPDSDKNLMRNCPLTKESITIKLKQDDSNATGTQTP